MSQHLWNRKTKYNLLQYNSVDLDFVEIRTNPKPMTHFQFASCHRGQPGLYSKQFTILDPFRKLNSGQNFHSTKTIIVRSPINTDTKIQRQTWVGSSSFPLQILTYQQRPYSLSVLNSHYWHILLCSFPGLLPPQTEKKNKRKNLQISDQQGFSSGISAPEHRSAPP